MSADLGQQVPLGEDGEGFGELHRLQPVTPSMVTPSMVTPSPVGLPQHLAVAGAVYAAVPAVGRLLRATWTLRRHGVRHGRLPSFGWRVPIITNDGRMRVGSRFCVRSQQFPAAFATGPGGSLDIGDDVFVNQGAVLHAELSVTLGSRVRVGDLAAIYDTSFHEVEPGGGVHTAPVIVGDDVWIARGAVVLPGSTLGDGCVVATGAVVRGEVPPWVVAAGNPARVVRQITARGCRL